MGSFGGQVFTNYDNSSGANYQATFTVSGTLPSADPSDDLNRNWSYSRTYDLDGNVTSEGKQFVDAMGRPTQTQSKNLAEQQVFATQSLNNKGGVPVLSTLPAPINNREFKYKEGFVTATTTPAGGGTPVSANYSATNFEKPTGSTPDPVDETTPGTLGYYYSQNNTLEPAIAATHNPFSLSEPMPGPLGGVRRAAGPGDAFALGSGHESRGRDFPLLNELDQYSRLRTMFVPNSPAPSLRAQGVKIVAVNTNGVEAISFRNREGQSVASCLTGDQYPSTTLTGTLTSDLANPAGNPAYQDIHVAVSASLTALTITDGATSGTPSSYILIDLQQNPMAEAAFSGSQVLNLSPGFYRLLITSGQVNFSYQVHYGDFSYVYYDDAGRVVGSIAPKGVPGSTSYVRNGNFELGNADTGMWQSPGSFSRGYLEASSSAHPSHSGNYYWVHYYPSGPWQAHTIQLVTGLPTGRYTLRAWVQSLGNVQATMRAISNGVTQEASFSDMTNGMPWREIVLNDIDVIDGQCEVGFHSSAAQGSGIRFDDVELVRQDANPVRNSGSEQPGSTAWQSRSSVGSGGGSFQERATSRPAHSGAFYWAQYKDSNDWNLYTYQTVTGLANGRYTLRAWVQSSGGQHEAWMQAISGGVTQTVLLTDVAAGMPWRQVALADIVVTNGECEIGFYSRSYQTTWLTFDDVELVWQDANTVRDSRLEQPGSTAWQSTSGSYREKATSRPAHSGNYYWTQYKDSGPWSGDTYQTVTGLVNGRYTLRAWVQSTGNQQQAVMRVQDYGGAVREVAFPAMTPQTLWQELVISDIVVTNNQCKLGFYSAFSQSGWIAFDDVELLPQGASPLPAFTTRNTYDTSSRLLATESGDEGRSTYVYAQDGRIRFSQSALQAQPTDGKPRRFSYSNYDSAGRIIESGEYTESVTPGQGFTFEDMRTASPAANSVLQAALLEERVTNANPNGSLAANQCAQRQRVWYDLPQPDAALGSHQQDFVLGAVAKTSNGTSTTWYSYDDRGQLTWLVQQAPGVNVKTVDYTYDAAGNVTQVAYQQGQSDSFYHYYTYDANQRLTQALTSPDGATRTLQARYFYYLHGPLKRVETAGNLQGTDYTYTVQGWLKSINGANRRLDGDSPKANGFTKDLFGLTLDYFSGDYRSAQASMATPTIAGALATRYDGTVRSAAWSTAVSPLVRQQVFTYDAKGQLQQADFGELVPGSTPTAAGTFTASSTHAYEEGNLRYDSNGNIQTLRRRDGAGVATDDFTYQYPSGSNRLSAVNNPSGTAVLDYEYDAVGQMTRQRDEQGQRYLTYDVTGKVTGVYRDLGHAQPLVVFTYDDRGFRASKASYDPTTFQLKKTTYSVRDMAGNELATYTLDATTPGSGVQQSEVPLYGASRLGTLTRLDNGNLDYRYELNDQLGSARLIYHRPTTTTYTATMEPTAATQEEQDFTNVATTRYAAGGHNGSTNVSLLGITSGQRIGPSKTLTVQKGDTVTFTAYAWLTAAINQPGGPHQTNAMRTASLAGLTMLANPTTSGALTGPQPEATSPSKSASWLPRLSLGIGIPLGTRQSPTKSTATTQAITGSSGSAYLHFIVRDEKGNSIRDDYQEVNGSSAGTWQQLRVGLRLAQAGTVELRVETDGATGPDVYFDDVQVDYATSTIVQEQHNYAFGAPMLGLNYVIGSSKYRHGYQGKFAEKDEETGTDDFELRLYDSRIGRWTAPDPAGQFYSPYVGMGNNPVSNVDADGGFAFASLLPMIQCYGLEAGAAISKAAVAAAPVTIHIGIGAATTAVRIASQGPGKPQVQTASYPVTWEPVRIPFPQTLPGGLGALGLEEVIAAGAFLSPLIFLSIPGDHAITSRPIPEATITLYRGVHGQHPSIAAARKGIAIPWADANPNSRSHNSPALHNGGNTNSIFTSWTYSRYEASDKANEFGPGGVILKKKFNMSQLVPSIDGFKEGEWLVPGIVEGATVLKPYKKY
jgi:RHS repeat-associated protein